MQTAEALIVSHGQPSNPEPAEQRLRELAVRVGALLPGWRVRSATLAAPGALEGALEDVASAPLIFPLFMANGWFTKQALPERIGVVASRILDPLGLDPSLPVLAVERTRRELARKGWREAETDLLLVAHGSLKGRPNPARCAQAFAAALQARSEFRSVRVGFLEQAPRLPDIAALCGPQAICLPYFAAAGGHVCEDIPQELTEAGFQGSTLPAVGVADFVPSLIANTLRTARSQEAAA